VAEALFSSIQGDIHLINTAGMGTGMGSGAGCVLSSGQQLSTLMDSGSVPAMNSSHMAAFHQKMSPLEGGQGEEGASTKQSPSSAAQRHQEEAKQAMAVFRQQCGGGGGGEEIQTQHHHSSSSSSGSRKQRQHSSDINKGHAGGQNRLGSNSSNCFISPAGGARIGDDHGGGVGNFDNGVLNSALYGSMQNHIKLPDMQTLAHSLPKYPSGGGAVNKKGSSGAPPVSVHHGSSTPGIITTTKNELVCDSVVTYASSASVPSSSCSPRSGGTTTSLGPGGNVNLDQMMSINIEVQSELDTDGVLVQRKRFRYVIRSFQN